MASLRVSKVLCEATAGAQVDRTLRDALTLAVDEWRYVEVRHNDDTYTIDPDAVMNLIIKTKKMQYQPVAQPKVEK